MADNHIARERLNDAAMLLGKIQPLLDSFGNPVQIRAEQLKVIANLHERQDDLARADVALSEALRLLAEEFDDTTVEVRTTLQVAVFQFQSHGQWQLAEQSLKRLEAAAEKLSQIPVTERLAILTLRKLLWEPLITAWSIEPKMIHSAAYCHARSLVWHYTS